MEIERKFIVKDMPDLSTAKEVWHIEQAYLCGKPTLRIRKKNDEYILTYKSQKGLGKMCKEFNTRINEEVELPLSKSAYEHLLSKCDDNVVYKTRYIFPLDEKHKAELDVFRDKLEGLRMVEVEFETPEEAKDFVAPEWFGTDVSADSRFSNRMLSKMESYNITDPGADNEGFN
ncbi:MAG: CYTH domain-containing protein [Lachnospiraceae bacterium]|nr:CYTH domain-containing protein [Lachnospiraceae bacterium]